MTKHEIRIDHETCFVLFLENMAAFIHKMILAIVLVNLALVLAKPYNFDEETGLFRDDFFKRASKILSLGYLWWPSLVFLGFSCTILFLLVNIFRSALLPYVHIQTNKKVIPFWMPTSKLHSNKHQYRVCLIVNE